MSMIFIILAALLGSAALAAPATRSSKPRLATSVE
jgi:hypothetical protein